ncbi:TPA: oligoribonuclease [Candidatus Saccharibacteria bacterium]|nr:oligoribonuclease [Candidatus Saccharibacteria bacterium]HIO87765.1 oligoribonuclease [Candidatus Saccharibacteria bacterium]
MTDNTKKASLLWIDLEMTGIEPDNSKIIEVGVIATDWDMTEIATYETVIAQDQATLDQADPWVKENMAELLSKSTQGIPEAQAEQTVVDLVQKHFDLKQPVYLAGNSIHQDRRFIRKYWPKLEALLHYRMVDVSAWKVVMAHKYAVNFKKESSHRALEDIRGSIEEMKLYFEQIKD